MADTKGYAHIVDGKVVNVSRWDGETPIEWPEGVEVVPIPTVEETDETTGESFVRHLAGIGWDYVDGEFVDNRPVDEDSV